jgi:hypothetical protein
MIDPTQTVKTTKPDTPKATNAFTPPIPTGTPAWVTKMKEDRSKESWDIRIIRQAIDLFTFNDGSFWCAGSEGEGYYGNYVQHDVENDNRVNTDAAHTPFVPFHEAWTRMPEAWIDAMPNGQYQLVTDKVCAIGSIQLLIGGGDDNADYQTIIERLNELSMEVHGSNSIVSVNDGIGRQAVLKVMNRYVEKYGGREGYILPDFKPIVRLDRKDVEPIESDED